MVLSEGDPRGPAGSPNPDYYRPKPKAALLALEMGLAEALDRIKAMFKPGAKVTVVVRNPGYGDAGVVIGDDDLDEVIAEIERRKGQGS
jgi:hypothetical protein